jgi:hypothetical protein
MYPVTRQTGTTKNLRTTTLPTTACTMMAWFRMVNNRAAFSSLLCANASATAAGAAANYCLQTSADGVSVGVYNDSVLTDTGFDMPIGQWVHGCVTATNGGAVGSVYTAYINGRPLAQATKGGTAFTVASIVLGNDQDAEWFDGQWCSWKCWNKVLTTQMIQREMKSLTPAMKDALVGYLAGDKVSTTADLWTKNAWAGVAGSRAESAPSMPPLYVASRRLMRPVIYNPVTPTGNNSTMLLTF